MTIESKEHCLARSAYDHTFRIQFCDAISLYYL